MSKEDKYKDLTPEEKEELILLEKSLKELTRKANRVSGFKKNSCRYTIEKEMATRLKAAFLVILAAAGGIVTLSSKSQARGVENKEEKCTIASIISTREQQTPIIEVDGMQVELDFNSTVLVEGEIHEGKNYAFAFDQTGSRIEGYIDSQILKSNIEMDKEEIDDYVLYQVVSEEGAQLVQYDEKTTSISYGDFVIGREEHDESVYVLYPSGDEILRGEIDEKALEIVNELSAEQHKDEYLEKVVVNTSMENYAGLSFRSSPDEEKYSIMMKIPNGTVLNTTGETTIANGRHWTKVEYEGQLGWVATEYLEEFVIKEAVIENEEIDQEEEQEEEVKEEYVENSGIKNMSGNVTGIDVSEINPNQLRLLLENGIPTEVIADKLGNINTYAVAGDINFVHIKLGASSYGNGEIEIIDYNKYEQTVKICEELGIPYGFYYYSTATTVEEAEIEAEHIEQVMEKLRNKYDMKYNILPMTIDKELTGKDDRQYGKDITDATAYLINTMQSEGISEKVLLYIPGRIIDENDSDKLIDLEKLKEQLTDLENFAIWLCAPSTKKGYTTQRTANYCKMIEEKYGIKVVSQQIALDVHAPNGGKIDINNMEFEYYNEIINQKEEIATEPTENEYDSGTEEEQKDESTESAVVEDEER